MIFLGFFGPFFWCKTLDFFMVHVCLLVGVADLLYKDYQSDQRFTITTYPSAGFVSLFLCFFLNLFFGC